jgi:hypothetical protein
MPHKRVALMAMLTVAASAGCGSEEIPYQPRQAPSGVKASLPPVPNVPQKPVKAGDAYTIWGASYYLRSRVHQKEVAGQNIKLTGYITKTNLPDAPECAVHETGKADPEGCNAPVPAFWIADTKDADVKDSIKVMGWASNFAQLYDAIEAQEKNKNKDKKDVEPQMDAFWGVKIPDPLPVKGMKVTVKGTYGTTFTRSTAGAEADPIMGIMTYEELEVLEATEEKATLPGMKKR